MKKVVYITLIALFFVSVIGTDCFATAVTRPERKPWATISDEKVFGQKDPGKALVYFIRQSHMGYGVFIWTFCDDQFLGMNRGRSYFYSHLSPGKHLLWAKAENVAPYEVELEAGKTYYFEERVLLGAFTPRTDLKLLSEEKGRELLGKYKYKIFTPTDIGTKKGETMAKKFYPKAKNKMAKIEKKRESKPRRKSSRVK